MSKRIATASSLLMLPALVLGASELQPRDHIGKYPYACKLEAGVIGVDYLRRGLPTPRGVQIIPGVLIFEIAAYPNSGEIVPLPASSFELDWKKISRPIGPVEPGWVLARLRHPEWNYKGLQPEISVGTYDPARGGFGGIRVGEPRSPRFPDDPRQRRPPSSPEKPSSSRVPKSEPHPDELPERIVTLHAFPKEPIDRPSAGFLYFAYDGKLKNLKQLTMKIHLNGETCELRLERP